jgi:hypothetical protein
MCKSRANRIASHATKNADDTLHATTAQLANLINIIAEAMITQPKAIDELYKGLPQTKLKEIEKRDAASTTQRPGPAP